MRRDDICLHLNPADRAELEALIGDRNTPAKVVWRAEIVLATADGHGTNEIMRRSGKSKPCVWRWQERFVAEGVEGLKRDKTRPSRKPPLSQAVKTAVLTKTASERPANATHWSRASMARAMGISASAVGRIWREAGLKPHRLDTFKISNDPMARHKRFHLHFTPTSASWLNLVERFFAEITREWIRRGVFTSVAELEQAIHDYLDRRNAAPKPFVWTKSAEVILAKEVRAKAAMQAVRAGTKR